MRARHCRPRSFGTLFCVLPLLLLVAGVAAAQPDESSGRQRPRIGLALSGGGARGLAHVGVLKVLEELRIPVDYIAGTSMGSIVGGLYALGLSPAQIETAVLAIDWRELFTDTPRRQERSFRRKQDDRSDLLDFEVGIRRGKLNLPRNLVAGQKLAFAFDVEALHTAGERSFDDLPIPFRATATDIQSGELVILERGSLVRALRASMSVPGIFAPVEVDGQLLVDGGLVRNLPIDVLEDLGAEVIIGVDVAEKLSTRSREELASLLGLSFQLINLTMRVSTDSLLPRADVVIQPDLGDVSLIDFDQAAAAIAGGERSTREAHAALQHLSVSARDYDAFLQRQRRVPEVVARIATIELDNRSRVDERAVLQRLSIRAGESLQLDRLKQDLLDVYDLGSLELVDFELVNPGERTTLRVFLHEKTYGPNLFHLGMRLSSDLQDKTTFNARARLTRMELNALGAEWRTDFRFGSAKEVRSEWYQPLEFRRHLFAALQVGYESDFQPLYDFDERTAEYQFQDARANLDIGLQLGRFGELRTGPFFGYVRSRVKTGRADISELDARHAGWRTRLAYDLVDDPDFPKHGSAGEVALQLARESLGSALHYDRLSASWGGFDSWSDYTGFLVLAAGSSLGSVLPPHREFLLGGMNSLSGYNDGQLRGRVFATARLGVYRPITGAIDLLGTRLYAATWFEVGNVWSSHADVRLADLHYPWTLALGANTLLGPVYLAYGRTENREDSVFLTVGRQVGVQP